MAQPIAFHAPEKTAPVHMERSRNAPAEHAEAILSGYGVLQFLHDRGVLNLLRGVLDAGDELIGTITTVIDTPNSIRVMRNSLLLTKLLASIPPDVLSSLGGPISAGAKRDNGHKAPGLLRILMAASQ
jgi:hypothetical protein